MATADLLHDRAAPDAPGERRERAVVQRRSGGTWAGPLVVTVLAFVLRVWHLGTPRGVIFDEVYYAKDSYDLLRHGVELNGTENGPGFVVHPPLGKWAIALGQAAFGHNEVGWRISAAVAGSLTVLIVARIALRLTGSVLLGSFAGLLVALDGLEFVQSRVAMLDIFLLLWLAAALGCLVIDHDTGHPPGRGQVRWWRIATGGCLGAAVATKWSALYDIAAFAALALAWDFAAGDRGRAEPYPVPERVAELALGRHIRPAQPIGRRLAAVRRELPQWLLAYAVLPALLYVVSWGGWFATGTGWDRHTYGSGSWATWRGWWHYQWEIWHFHKTLTAHHTYQSTPFSWLILGRPVSYYYSSPKPGTAGCHSSTDCAREVLAIGTPAIWWAGVLAVLAVAVWGLLRRDWRGLLVAALFVANFAPWLLLGERTMFLFYALPLVPVYALALALAAGFALGPPRAPDTRRLAGALGVGAYAVIVLIDFAYLYPLLAGVTISMSAWQARIWFPSWI